MILGVTCQWGQEGVPRLALFLGLLAPAVLGMCAD